jgi:hypothetical protein
MDMPKEEEARENEIVSGVLLLTVNGETRRVPELKWRANREWQDRLQATFVELASVPVDTPDGLRAMADAERELVMAYDATHALGDLDDATEREVDAIYNRLIEVSFPLAQSQAALMVGLIRATTSAVLNSTSSPSPTGTSAAPTTLRPRSRTARSGSSSPRRKSA